MPKKIDRETPSLSEMLGLKHHQAAELLDVSRSQWSMFGIQKGSLPPQAIARLTELLQLANAAKASKTPEADAINKAVREGLDKRRRSVAFKLMQANRNIAAAERTLEKQIEGLALLRQLEGDGQSLMAQRYRSMLRAKCSEAHRVDAELKLIQLRIAKQLLEHEQQLLEAAMGN